MVAEWRTVKSIANELGIHTMTVYRLINSNRLPASKVGRSYRIKESDFQAYLKGARISGDSRD
jgi:excisionase family DNA binding protein